MTLNPIDNFHLDFFMRSRHFLASGILACFTLNPPQALAVDPVTAGIIVEGVNLVASALEKPQPNLTLEIVQRNRELLIGMNTKLDQLGDNLIKLHAAVGDIPEKLAEELDKERLYVHGVKAAARGQSLLDYIEEFEGDQDRYADQPDDLEEARKDYYSRLDTLEVQVTNLGNEIAQEDSIRNVDAVTLALIAHSHLSTLTEIVVRFDRRKSRLEGAARTYGKRLDTVLTEEANTLAGWTRNRFNGLPDHAGWKMLHDKFNLPFVDWDGPGDMPLTELAGRSLEQCIVRQNQKAVREYRPAIPSKGEPAHDITRTTLLSEDFFVRRLMFGTGPGQSLTASLITEPSSTDCREGRPVITVPTQIEHVHQSLGSMLEVIHSNRRSYAPEDCLTACGLGEQQAALDAAMDQVHALLPSTRILAMLSELRDSTKAVREGDYSGFQVSDTLSSFVIYRDTIRDQIEARQAAAEQQELGNLEEERLRVAREVSQLIDRQDREIAALFDEAARAAKFNRTLGYVRLAAKVYHGWVRLDGYLTKGEKKEARATLEAAKQGLQEAKGREPANMAVVQGLRLLDNINKLVEFYGGIEQASNAQSHFDQVLTETINAIPAGAEQSFDVYVDEKDPMQFRFMVPSGDFVLKRPGETYLKRITLKGAGLGTGQAMGVHLDLRDL